MTDGDTPTTTAAPVPADTRPAPAAGTVVNPVGLRRALRVCWLAPLVLAVGLWSGQEAATLYAVFGVIAALVMADFGGPLWPRALAYLQLAVVGAVLALAGTALSTPTALAVVGTVAVIFVVQYAGVFGGYPAAGATAASLAFLLSVLTPAPLDAAPPRMVGWFIGVALGGVVAVLVWPVHEKAQFRTRTSRLCTTLADLVRGGADLHPAPPEGAATDDPVNGEVRAAKDQVEALLVAYGTTPYRPAGPTDRDQALLAVMDRLDRSVGFLASVRLSARTRGDGDGTTVPVAPGPTDDQLRDAVATTLDQAGALLAGGDRPPDLAALRAARVANQRATNDRVAAIAARGGGIDEAAATLDTWFPLRVMSYLAVGIAANAMVATGHAVEDPAARELGLVAGGGETRLRVVDRVVDTVRAHLRLGDVWFRNSARAAIALAASVLVADLVAISHAFWVALATLSALRSNGSGTNTTAVQAVIGNVIGFAVASALLVVAGDSTWALWVILPVTLFACGYAPGSVGLIGGQAAFAVAVVILFNVISPAGLITGVERVEAVALGGAVSVAAALLMWPRGARGQVGNSLARLLRSSGRYLNASFTAFTADADDRDRLVPVADRARDVTREDRGRLITAVSQLLNEHGGQGALDPADVVRLMAVPDTVALAGEATSVLPRLGYRPEGCDECRLGIAAHTTALMGAVDAAADQLEGEPAIQPELPDLDRLSSDLRRCMGDRLTREGAAAVPTAVGLVVSTDWLRYLDDITADLAAPSARLQEAVHRPWWR